MLILNTGTPGAGKTLFTLWTVENRRVQDNKELMQKWIDAGSDQSNPPIQRDVYYFNIAIKKLPWIKLDKPEDWLNCPKGSIVVFDECQEAFPPRANSSQPPLYVSELAKARHGGYDIYFITQHPTFTDPYIRKLTEQHNHLMRPFGAKKAVVHSWKGVKDNCDKSRKDSMTSSFGYPKEVYSWYKSAEIHTHKFSMPWKIWALFLLPPLIAVCAWYTYSYFEKKTHPVAPLKAPLLDARGRPITPVAGGDRMARVMENRAINDDLSQYKPRIQDLPQTAPRYDELTVPTVAPIIQGCMVYQNRCKCLTQQGTYVMSSMEFCQNVIANGLFIDYGRQSDKQDRQQDRPEKQTVAAASETSTRPDNGFNLPPRTIDQKYGQQYTTQQSGNIYFKQPPESRVMPRP
jgi:hypothetical protein